MLTWGSYERLRPDQIEMIRAKTPIAYVPWGALEWHSYHAPVGLDGIKALGLCEALAQRTGGVVLPPMYIGTDTIKPFKGFGHTLEHSPGLVGRLCTELLTQLAEEGFRLLITVTGHAGGGHTDALKAASEAFAADHPDVFTWTFPDFEPCDPAIFPANHAAQGETALQLLFDPEPVDLIRLPPDRVPTLDEDGVWGEDPRTADAETGRHMLAHFLDRTVPRIIEQLE